MERSLFTDRARIAIADSYRRTGIFRLMGHDPARAELALQGLRDVPEDAAKCISKSEGSPQSMLQAFWQTFADDVPPLAPVAARLMVNPPEGIEVNAACQMALSTQSILRGSYGLPITGKSLPLNSLITSQIDGTHTGFFDDVTIFWDEGVKGEHLLPVILPMTTLTLIRPNLSEHRFWMAWADLDMNFGTLLDALQAQYTLREITDTTVSNFVVTILGIESK